MCQIRIYPFKWIFSGACVDCLYPCIESRGHCALRCLLRTRTRSGSLVIISPSWSLRTRRGISRIQRIEVETCAGHVTCFAAVWVIFSPPPQTTAQQPNRAGVKEPGMSELLQFPDCFRSKRGHRVHTHPLNSTCRVVTRTPGSLGVFLLPANDKSEPVNEKVLLLPFHGKCCLRLRRGQPQSKAPTPKAVRAQHRDAN